MTCKCVLLIAYWFPPRHHVASLRARGLARFLPEFGWEPVVLTAKLPGTPDVGCRVVGTPYPGDATGLWKGRMGLSAGRGFQEQLGISHSAIERRKPLAGRIIKVVKSVLAYPDDQRLWYRHAVSVGDAILRHERIDAILSSSGPVTSHLVASKLKDRYGVPWIADFRDLWTQNHYYPYGPMRFSLERRLELKTMRAADAFVTISDPLARQLGELHSGRPVYAIPNGYDPDEVASAPLTEELTITYTGQLYQGKQDPVPLLEGLAELLSEGEIAPGDVRVRFYGPNPHWLEEAVVCRGLESLVSLHPTIPRVESLQRQRESHILLLLNWDHPREIGVYTGKVFEYLAARRPILALGGSEGVVSDLLRETGAGVHVANRVSLKRVLKGFHEEYKANGTVQYHGNDNSIVKYSHRNMTRRFAAILDEVVGQKPR